LEEGGLDTLDFKYDLRREENKVYLEIEIPPAEVDRRLDEKLEELRKNSQVPGFRVGRAPRAIVEMYYGKAVASKVKMDLLTEASTEAIERCDITPISPPDLETPDDLVRGRPFVFRISMDVLPEAKLGDYKSITLEPVPRREIKEEEIESWIRDQKEKRTVLQPVMDRDTVQIGDFVRISYEVSVNGEWRDDLSVEDMVIRVEEGDKVLSQALIGAHAGETRRIKVPEGMGFKGIPAEGDVEMVVAINGIFSGIEASDEDLMREFGCEDMDQLREKAREELEGLAEEERRRAMKRQLLEKLLEISEVSIPDTLIERRIELLSLLGLPQHELRKAAEIYEKERIVLDTLARVEGISVSEEEVESMKGSSESKREIRERLKREKVLDHLLNILTCEAGG
jgi:trigger factor